MVVERSIENPVLVVHSEAVRLVEDQHVAELEVGPEVVLRLPSAALVEPAKERMAKVPARKRWAVVQCFVAVAYLHMQGQGMAASLVLGHSGWTPVLPTWVGRMVKLCAGLVVAVVRRTQQAALGRRG